MLQLSSASRYYSALEYVLIHVTCFEPDCIPWKQVVHKYHTLQR